MNVEPLFPPRDQPGMFDDTLRAEVRFCQSHGWEWSVRHFDGHSWATLDSGTTRSYNAALHHLQRTLGELDSRY